jgi:hypothetical protein
MDVGDVLQVGREKGMSSDWGSKEGQDEAGPGDERRH